MKRLHVGAFAALLLATCSSVQAQSVGGAIPTGEGALPIVRIEEDWIALIRNPDPEGGAPQIVNAMSPDGRMDGNYGLFEINHTSSPEFVKGGFQVQAWNDDSLLQRRNSSTFNVLSRGYDRLEYTTVMEITNGELKFELTKGKSRTWGKFARDGELHASSPTTLTSFTEYNRQHSIDNTSVNVGAHRVEALYQRRVRFYSAEGLVQELDTIEVIHRFAKVVTDELKALWESNPAYFNVEITE